MVLKEDQAKVKALLTEAITVLCKNGLSYRNEFSVEGLLGVTLDNEEVFLISINETIREIGGQNMSPNPPSVQRRSPMPAPQRGQMGKGRGTPPANRARVNQGMQNARKRSLDGEFKNTHPQQGSTPGTPSHPSPHSSMGSPPGTPGTPQQLPGQTDPDQPPIKRLNDDGTQDGDDTLLEDGSANLAKIKSEPGSIPTGDGADWDSTQTDQHDPNNQAMQMPSFGDEFNLQGAMDPAMNVKMEQTGQIPQHSGGAGPGMGCGSRPGLQVSQGPRVAGSQNVHNANSNRKQIMGKYLHSVQAQASLSFAQLQVCDELAVGAREKNNDQVQATHYGTIRNDDGKRSEKINENTSSIVLNKSDVVILGEEDEIDFLESDEEYEEVYEEIDEYEESPGPNERTADLGKRQSVKRNSSLKDFFEVEDDDDDNSDSDVEIDCVMEAPSRQRNVGAQFRSASIESGKSQSLSYSMGSTNGSPPNLADFTSEDLGQRSTAQRSKFHACTVKDNSSEVNKKPSLSHEGSEYLHCSYCNKYFKTRKGLNNHLSVHTGCYRFYCEKCRTGFNSKERYEKDQNRHAGRGLICLNCRKVYLQPKDLERHISTCNSDVNNRHFDIDAV